MVAGPTATSVDIVIQPTTAFTGYLTNVVFVLQIPQGVQQPTITKTALSPYFTSFNDLTTLANEGGYTTYGFSAVNASVTSNVTLAAGDNYPVLRLSFAGGAAGPTDIRLAHLADGGPGSLYQNYVEANAVGPGTNDYTNYVQMFFGTLVVPASPVASEVIGYSTYQYSQMSQLLPVAWLSFNATKQGNDGLLNWTVGNENSNKYYELQRSTNGTSFTAIGTVNKSGTGVYNFTDPGINTLGTQVVYYRIKQVDLNGRTSYSDIRVLRLDIKESDITIFPNPVKDGFYVGVPLANAGSKRVKLSLVAGDGKIVAVKEISAAQASNYYFDIKDKPLAAGQYNLQIIYEDKVLSNKKIFINQ